MFNHIIYNNCLKETALTKTKSFFAMLAFLAKIDTFFRFFPFIRSFRLPFEYTVILSCYDGASHCSHYFSFKNQLLLTIYQTTKFCFNRVENFVRKGEIAGYQHFLLFPQCFQEAFSSGVS